MSSESDFGLQLKRYLFLFAANLLKFYFYFFAIVWLIFYNVVPASVFSAYSIITIFVLLEFTYEILLSTPINKKQCNFLFKFFGLVAIPVSLLPYGYFQQLPYLLIPATFAVLAFLTEIFGNLFSSSRRVFSVILLLFTLIIVYTIWFQKIDVNFLINQIFFLTLLSILSLRLAQYLPQYKFDLDEELKKTIIADKQIKEKIDRYSIKFNERNTQAIIMNNKIYFVSDGILYSNYQEEIKDAELIKSAKKIVESKTEIKTKLRKYNPSPQDVFSFIGFCFFSIFFSYELLRKYTIFVKENYYKIFPNGNELDKHLFDSDADLSIISNDLSESFLNLIIALKEFIKYPSDHLLSTIRHIENDALNKIYDGKIHEKIDDRIKTAEKLYKSKLIMSLALYNLAKNSIEKDIEFFEDFKDI